MDYPGIWLSIRAALLKYSGVDLAPILDILSDPSQPNRDAQRVAVAVATEVLDRCPPNAPPQTREEFKKTAFSAAIYAVREVVLQGRDAQETVEGYKAISTEQLQQRMRENPTIVMQTPLGFQAPVLGAYLTSKGLDTSLKNIETARHLFKQMYNQLPPEARKWVDLAGETPDTRFVITNTITLIPFGAVVNLGPSDGAVQGLAMHGGTLWIAGEAPATVLSHEATHRVISLMYNNYARPWKEEWLAGETSDTRRTLLMEALRLDLERNGRDINTMRRDLGMGVYRGQEFSIEVVVRICDQIAMGQWTGEMQQKYPALDRFVHKILLVDREAFANGRPLPPIDAAGYRAGDPAAVGRQPVYDWNALAKKHFGLSPEQTEQVHQSMRNPTNSPPLTTEMAEYLLLRAFMDGNVPQNYVLTPKQRDAVREIRSFESRLPTGDHLHPSYQLRQSPDPTASHGGLFPGQSNQTEAPTREIPRHPTAPPQESVTSPTLGFSAPGASVSSQSESEGGMPPTPRTLEPQPPYMVRINEAPFTIRRSDSASSHPAYQANDLTLQQATALQAEAAARGFVAEPPVLYDNSYRVPLEIATTPPSLRGLQAQILGRYRSDNKATIEEGGKYHNRVRAFCDMLAAPTITDQTRSVLLSILNETLGDTLSTPVNAENIASKQNELMTAIARKFTNETPDKLAALLSAMERRVNEHNASVEQGMRAEYPSILDTLRHDQLRVVPKPVAQLVNSMTHGENGGLVLLAPTPEAAQQMYDTATAMGLFVGKPQQKPSGQYELSVNRSSWDIRDIIPYFERSLPFNVGFGQDAEGRIVLVAPTLEAARLMQREINELKGNITAQDPIRLPPEERTPERYSLRITGDPRQLPRAPARAPMESVSVQGYDVYSHPTPHAMPSPSRAVAGALSALHAGNTGLNRANLVRHGLELLTGEHADPSTAGHFAGNGVVHMAGELSPVFYRQALQLERQAAIATLTGEETAALLREAAKSRGMAKALETVAHRGGQGLGVLGVATDVLAMTQADNLVSIAGHGANAGLGLAMLSGATPLLGIPMVAISQAVALNEAGMEAPRYIAAQERAIHDAKSTLLNLGNIPGVDPSRILPRPEEFGQLSRAIGMLQRDERAGEGLPLLSKDERDPAKLRAAIVAEIRRLEPQKHDLPSGIGVAARALTVGNLDDVGGTARNHLHVLNEALRELGDPVADKERTGTFTDRDGTQKPTYSARMGKWKDIESEFPDQAGQLEALTARMIRLDKTRGSHEEVIRAQNEARASISNQLDELARMSPEERATRLQRNEEFLKKAGIGRDAPIQPVLTRDNFLTLATSLGAAPDDLIRRGFSAEVAASAGRSNNSLAGALQSAALELAAAPLTQPSSSPPRSIDEATQRLRDALVRQELKLAPDAPIPENPGREAGMHLADRVTPKLDELVKKVDTETAEKKLQGAAAEQYRINRLDQLAAGVSQDPKNVHTRAAAAQEALTEAARNLATLETADGIAGTTAKERIDEVANFIECNLISPYNPMHGELYAKATAELKARADAISKAREYPQDVQEAVRTAARAELGIAPEGDIPDNKKADFARLVNNKLVSIGSKSPPDTAESIADGLRILAQQSYALANTPQPDGWQSIVAERGLEITRDPKPEGRLAYVTEVLVKGDGLTMAAIAQTVPPSETIAWVEETNKALAAQPEKDRLLALRDRIRQSPPGDPVDLLRAVLLHGSEETRKAITALSRADQKEPAVPQSMREFINPGIMPGRDTLVVADFLRTTPEEFRANPIPAINLETVDTEKLVRAAHAMMQLPEPERNKVQLAAVNTILRELSLSPLGQQTVLRPPQTVEEAKQRYEKALARATGADKATPNPKTGVSQERSAFEARRDEIYKKLDKAIEREIKEGRLSHPEAERYRINQLDEMTAMLSPKDMTNPHNLAQANWARFEDAGERLRAAQQALGQNRTSLDAVRKHLEAEGISVYDPRHAIILQIETQKLEQQLRDLQQKRQNDAEIGQQAAPQNSLSQLPQDARRKVEQAGASLTAANVTMPVNVEIPAPSPNLVAAQRPQQQTPPI